MRMVDLHVALLIYVLKTIPIPLLVVRSARVTRLLADLTSLAMLLTVRSFL